MRYFATLTVTALALALLGGPVLAQNGGVTDAEVDDAIRRGCEYIVGMQKADGTWPPHKSAEHGGTVMAMLGLAYAEYDPQSEAMKKGVKALLNADLSTEKNRSYVTAFRLQALGKLDGLVDRETRDLVRRQMKEDAAAIIEGQTEIGGWSYGMTGGGGIGDFSNVQICVLGLGEAIKAGLELPREPLMKTQMLYINEQLPDGGWHYGRQVHDNWPWTTDQQMPSYGSMTAAGVASLFITRDYLYRGLGCPCRGGRSQYRRNKVDEAIDRGLAWLGEHFVPDSNPKSTHWQMYWLYSAERVALHSGIKYFGEHNWYQEGARLLLDSQGPGGGWGHVVRDGNWNSSGGTTFALLFLVKGRAPILMNKLQFDGPWNLHPQDLKNLTRYVGGLKEQTFAYQVINLDAPVDEWHDSPILYMVPEAAIEMTDEQKQKLREFTFDGGTILFEASCGNSSVRRWWEQTAEDIWPEFEFRRLDKDHELWNADVRMTGTLRTMQGMSDGMRTFVFYSPTDVSCAWNTSAITRRTDAFQFGNNIYAYATDRARIRSRLAGATRRDAARRTRKQLGLADGAPAEAVVGTARLKHTGDWSVTQHYELLGKLAEHLADGAPVTLEVHDPVEATAAADVPGPALLYATGRIDIGFSDADREALKQRLAGGAFLLVDAAYGDERFRKAFETFADGMGWQRRVLPDDHPLVSGQMAAGTGYNLADAPGWSFHALAGATAPLRLRLVGLYDGDKLIGVFSPMDLMYAAGGLRAFGRIGYNEDTARRIAENAVLWTLNPGGTSEADSR